MEHQSHKSVTKTSKSFCSLLCMSCGVCKALTSTLFSHTFQSYVFINMDNYDSVTYSPSVFRAEIHIHDQTFCSDTDACMEKTRTELGQKLMSSFDNFPSRFLFTTALFCNQIVFSCNRDWPTVFTPCQSCCKHRADTKGPCMLAVANTILRAMHGLIWSNDSQLAHTFFLQHTSNHKATTSSINICVRQITDEDAKETTEQLFDWIPTYVVDD